MGFGKFLLRYFEIMGRGSGMVPLLGPSFEALTDDAEGTH